MRLFRRSKKRAVVLTLVLAALLAGAWTSIAYTDDDDDGNGNGNGNGTNPSGVRAGEGVGLYSDSSTANNVSTFTLNRTMVSCGVGGLGLNVGTVGPFDMLMYSLTIEEYKVNEATNEIVAKGTMRSITRGGGNVVENAVHDFTAVGLDPPTDPDGDPPAGPSVPPRSDRFDIHFRTPFWQPGNPACTPSTREPGTCRFGGRILTGDVNVTSEDSEEHDD